MGREERRERRGEHRAGGGRHRRPACGRKVHLGTLTVIPRRIHAGGDGVVGEVGLADALEQAVARARRIPKNGDSFFVVVEGRGSAEDAANGGGHGEIVELGGSGLWWTERLKEVGNRLRTRRNTL